MTIARYIRHGGQSALLLLLSSTVLYSCEYLRLKTETEADASRVAIARAQDAYLYKDELSSITRNASSLQDSSRLAQSYINERIRKQLLINAAESTIDFEELELERKMLNYRYALLVHQMESNYASQKLDTVVEEAELQAYYEARKDEFILRRNIVKGKYVKLPLDGPKIDEVRGWISSTDQEDFGKLTSHAFQFAAQYRLDDSQWLEFEEMVNTSPLINQDNRERFIRTNKDFEVSDDQFVYLLHIDDFRTVGQIPPIEFVEQQIRNFIIQRRKVSLIKEFEQTIYENARKANEFEILE